MQVQVLSRAFVFAKQRLRRNKLARFFKKNRGRSHVVAAVWRRRMRVWFNGRMARCQRADGSSILLTRSNFFYPSLTNPFRGRKSLNEPKKNCIFSKHFFHRVDFFHTDPFGNGRRAAKRTSKSQSR